MAHGYFVKRKEFESLKNDLINRNFIGRWFPEGRDSIYELFNREYGWSSGYKSLTKEAWLNYEIETEDFEIVKYPDFSAFRINNFEDDEEAEQLTKESEVKYIEHKVSIKKLLAKVMRSSSRFLWEEQYDASQKEATSFDIPCGFLIEELELEQRNCDGTYYDKSGEIVAFYSKDSDKFDSPHKLLIRKKHLDIFLEKNELSIFWVCFGEKRFIFQYMRGQEWSQWSGLLEFKGSDVVGEMRKRDKEKPE